VYRADELAGPAGTAKNLALQLVSAALRGLGSELASGVKCRLRNARQDSGAARGIAQLAWEAIDAFSERIRE
jgi:hypothetical protein